MQQIEIQLRNIDSFDRERYKEYLEECLTNTLNKVVIGRYRNIICLINKLNCEK